LPWGGSTCAKSWERARADCSSTITQFLDYLDNFARYKEEDSLHSIAALFDAHPEISVVEKALLGNTRVGREWIWC
jgi:hypothetical protein